MEKSKPLILRMLLLIGKAILGIILLIFILILTIGSMVLIEKLQEVLFLPEAYIMWVFKYPFSYLVFIYECYIILGIFYAFNKYFRWGIHEKYNSLKRHKKTIGITFVALNILMLYTILFNVTVITNDKIIDYRFLAPKGKTYGYSDIIKINTGIYGRKINLPFSHYTRGDFYYIIQLKDGAKIDLMDFPGVSTEDNTDAYDPRFIIARLDSRLVYMGIPKVSSMEYFEYSTKELDKLYTDKIREILLNTK